MNEGNPSEAPSRMTVTHSEEVNSSGVNENSLLISLPPGPGVRYLQSDERSPCVLFLPIENSPLFMVSGMNQESIRGTN